jgi:hypothetical protein
MPGPLWGVAARLSDRRGCLLSPIRKLTEAMNVSKVRIRCVLYFAGAWNLIGGATALADPTRHIAQMYNGALSLDDPSDGRIVAES